VVKADALVAVLAETDRVERGLDSWHEEVPGAAPNQDRAMAVPYTGDRLCSSSTWWNTCTAEEGLRALATSVATRGLLLR
jgi:hypothetical protein